MALVARLRLLDRHRQSLGSRDVRVADVDHLRYTSSRVRVVAIRTGDAILLVDRDAGHRSGARWQVRQRSFRLDALIWPCGSWRVVQLNPLVANLMWAGNLLELFHVGVTAIADAGRNRAHVLRSSPERGQIPVRADIALIAARLVLAAHLEYRRDDGRLGHDRRRQSVDCRCTRFGGGRRSRGHIVVTAMAIDAGDSAIGIARTPPAGPLRTVRFFVATEAGFRTCDRIARLETEDQPRLSALGLHVTAGWPVAALAGVATMDVLGKRLGVCFVAVYAQLVIVDVFGTGDRGDRRLDLLIGNLREERVSRGQPASRFGSARRVDWCGDRQDTITVSPDYSRSARVRSGGGSEGQRKRAGGDGGEVRA